MVLNVFHLELSTVALQMVLKKQEGEQVKIWHEQVQGWHIYTFCLWNIPVEELNNAPSDTLLLGLVEFALPMTVEWFPP